jgi:UDP-glucuronate 4-epimerase
MKIVIVGAAGFIGSHLSEKLLKEGHEVTGIDNFDDFYSKEIKQNNLSDSLLSKNFTFLEIDIRDMHLLKMHISKADLIIHLAAKAGVMNSLIHPQDYIDTNISGTLNILNLMREIGCTKLIYASSSSVYGNNETIPFSEKNNVDQPVSPYAFTKKASELLNYTYHSLYKIDILNFRFFTVHGPRQRPDLAIHKFFNSIYNNLPIEIYGDGYTARDYTYIGDIINGINSGINYLFDKKDPIYEIINLGNNDYVYLKDLISSIEDISGKKFIKHYRPMRDGEMKVTHADIEKAGRLLGYKPQYKLRDGLILFKEWYEKAKR